MVPLVWTSKCGPSAAGAATLAVEEGRIRDFVIAHHDEDVALLERAVNISSGSQNVAGVQKVEVSYEKLAAVVTFDDTRTTVEALTKATENAGYPSTVKP